MRTPTAQAARPELRTCQVWIRMQMVKQKVRAADDLPAFTGHPGRRHYADSTSPTKAACASQPHVRHGIGRLSEPRIWQDDSDHHHPSRVWSTPPVVDQPMAARVAWRVIFGSPARMRRAFAGRKGAVSFIPDGVLVVLDCS